MPTWNNKKETPLTKAMDQYEELIARVHVNREAIRTATDENQQVRHALGKSKRLIMSLVKRRLAKQSLAQICHEDFGKLDRRFHVLFSFFRRG